MRHAINPSACFNLTTRIIERGGGVICFESPSARPRILFLEFVSHVFYSRYLLSRLARPHFDPRDECIQYKPRDRLQYQSGEQFHNQTKPLHAAVLAHQMASSCKELKSLGLACVPEFGGRDACILDHSRRSNIMQSLLNRG